MTHRVTSVKCAAAAVHYRKMVRLFTQAFTGLGLQQCNIIERAKATNCNTLIFLNCKPRRLLLLTFAAAHNLHLIPLPACLLQTPSAPEQKHRPRRCQPKRCERRSRWRMGKGRWKRIGGRRKQGMLCVSSVVAQMRAQLLRRMRRDRFGLLMRRRRRSRFERWSRRERWGWS